MQSIKTKPKPDAATAELRQIEAAKTSRLRALRLAKEAEEREAAATAAAAGNSRKPSGRVRAGPPAKGITSTT